MIRLLSAFALGILMAASLWLMGLIWFITLIPSAHQLQVTYKTDAIVVLTGGPGRAEHGLSLLQKGQAKWLFISGVHEQSHKSEIFQHLRRTQPNTYRQLEPRIILGKKALDTRGNALETAEWAKSRHISSLRLVTANYHIPRSLLEFERTMPHIPVVPAPVFTDHFKRGDWWQYKASLLLVLSEYHKSIASLAYGWLKKM